MTSQAGRLRNTPDVNLLDTHAFLWFVAGDSQLPASIRSKIEDISQPCFLSSASLWEITIKQQIGKLTLAISLQELFDYIDRNQIEIIQINYERSFSCPDYLLITAIPLTD